MAARLLDEIDTTGGIRLLGVGLAGLADWVQEDLFADRDELPDGAGALHDSTAPDDGGDPAAGPVTPSGTGPVELDPEEMVHSTRRWIPGMDVRHTEYGPGWVWGAGLGRVTVRFETADTGPGPVRTFAEGDSALSPTSG